MTLYELIIKLWNGFGRRFFSAFMRTQFKSFGRRSSIYRPMKLLGLSHMSIGAEVILSEMAWLQAMPLIEGMTPSISIDDGTYIGHFAHIVAVGNISIGRNVLIADRVYISDNIHGYQNPEVPSILQPVQFKGETSIGEGSWIGENVVVNGARIGCHCVIGANSVVTKDIPDFSVAVGAPARVVKIFDFRAREWRKV